MDATAGQPTLAKTFLTVAFAVALASIPQPVDASMWRLSCKRSCPLCGSEVLVCKLMSYGSYIYTWPSRYQWVFFPKTDPLALYTCTACGLTCWMWDFKEIPEEKRDALRQALKEVSLPPPDLSKLDEGERKTFDPKELASYYLIPMPDRLIVAEKVYQILGLPDREWCEFYRAAGYHYTKSGMDSKATDARRQSLLLAEKLLTTEGDDKERKDLLAICGVMRCHLGEQERGLEQLRQARDVKYRIASGRMVWFVLIGFLCLLVAVPIVMIRKLRSGRATKAERRISWACVFVTPVIFAVMLCLSVPVLQRWQEIQRELQAQEAGTNEILDACIEELGKPLSMRANAKGNE